jgi:hypothetical protein
MIAARAAAAVALLATAAAARAQAPAPTTTTAVAADRLTPAIGPGSFLGVEGGATTPARAVSWLATLGLVRDPIKLTQAYAGGLVSRPVRDQLVAQLGLELGVWKRLAVMLGVPVLLYQDGDRLRGLGVDESRLAATVAGDVRVRVKALLAGESARPGWHAALQLTVTAPAGGQRQFAASDGATLEPRLVVDWRSARFAIAANVGIRFAGERTLFTTTFGDELTWGAATSLLLRARAPGALTVVAEAEGAAGASTGTRPVELRAAARVDLGALALDGGAGFGVDGDAGAPAWRVFVLARGSLPLTR